MNSNFTVADLIGCTKALALFPLFLFVPGYVTGWATDVLDFRSRRLTTQLLLSTPLSVSVCPILTFLLGRFFGFNGIWAGYAVVWAAFAALVIRSAPHIEFRDLRCIGRAGVVIVIMWLLIVGSLVDLHIGNHLYLSETASDYAVRAKFTAAVMRSIPPANPFFGSSGSAPLRYHYFWMLMCSLPAKLAHIQPRLAMYAGTFWMGLALMATIATYLKFFANETCNLRRKTLVGAALLMVTGLDLVPTLALFLGRCHTLSGSIDFWNYPRIASWINALLWDAHYIASLIACLVGWLMLWMVAEVDRARDRVVPILIAGVAFASSVGLGIYVVFTFVIFCALWVILAARKEWLKEIAMLAAAGLVAAAFAMPYLASLRGHEANGQRFVGFGIRQFLLLDTWINNWGVKDVPAVVDLLALPLNYFLELGFFLAVCIIRLQRLRRGEIPRTRAEAASWAMVFSAVLIGSFLQSSGTNNDLGGACFLGAQFILLLWAVPLVDDWWFDRQIQFAGVSRSAMTFLLVVGMAGSVYEVLGLRLYWIILDHQVLSPWRAGLRSRPGQILGMRQVYEQLDGSLLPDALVQYNPRPWDKMWVPNLLYVNRAVAAGPANCGTQFGGDPRQCTPVYDSLYQLFNQPQPGDEWRLNAICREAKIDVLVTKDDDPVWIDQNSWVWKRQPVLANKYARAFACGARADTTTAQFSGPDLRSP